MAQWEWDASLPAFYLAVKAAGITTSIEAALPSTASLLGVVQPGDTVASLQRAVDPTTGRERVQIDRGWVSIENRLGQVLLVPIDVRPTSPRNDAVGGMTRHSSALADRLKVADAAVRKMQDAEAKSPEDKGEVGNASRQRAMKMKAQREERRQSQSSKVRGGLGTPFTAPVEQSLRRVVHELRRNKCTASSLFRQGDADGNGDLTAAELQLLLSQRIPKAQICGIAVGELVAALDSDGDGSITVKEFIAGVQQVKNRMAAAAAAAEDRSRSDGLQVRAEESQTVLNVFEPSARTPQPGDRGAAALASAAGAGAAGRPGHRHRYQKVSSSPIVHARGGRTRTVVLPLTTESPRKGVLTAASFDAAFVDLSDARASPMTSRDDSGSEWRRVLAAVEIQRCTRGHLTRIAVFSELSDLVSETLSRTQSQHSQSLSEQSAAGSTRWPREDSNGMTFTDQELEQLGTPDPCGEQSSRVTEWTVSSTHDELLQHVEHSDPEEMLHEYEPEPEPEPEPELETEPWLPEEKILLPPQSAPPVDEKMTVAQLLDKVDETAARFEATRALSRTSRPQGDVYIGDDTTDSDSDEEENDDGDGARLASLLQHIGMPALETEASLSRLATQFGVFSVQRLSTLSTAELDAALPQPFARVLTGLLE